MDKLERLKIAIKRKNCLEVRAIAWLMDAGSVDKEALMMAVESGNKDIAIDVVAKVDEKLFDREILVRAIETKNDDIVGIIAPKTNKKHFDEDILKLAIDSKHGGIVYEVSWFTKSEWYDRALLNRALATKDADVVRATVDRISDPEIFIEYRDIIQKAIFTAKDIKNLTAQILSRQDNQSNDREMQELVIDMYMDVIKDHYKKGELPVNFKMNDFENSMKLSRYLFSNSEAINLDSLNQPNRFLLLPIYGYGHAFSAVVRKLDNSDNISVTFINLGARPFEKSAEENQYKEYVYKPKDALKILKDYSYNIRLDYPARTVSVQEAYVNFQKDAIATYSINVSSRNQKVGNCFLKNIEKGIRYSLALSLTKAENREFKVEDLREGNNKQKLKVKFLKPIHSLGENTNELTTLQLREELLKSLKNKFPEFEKEINAEWDIYKIRKLKTQNKTPIIQNIWKMKTKEDCAAFASILNLKKTNNAFLDKMMVFAEKKRDNTNVQTRTI